MRVPRKGTSPPKNPVGGGAGAGELDVTVLIRPPKNDRSLLGLAAGAAKAGAFAAGVTWPKGPNAETGAAAGWPKEPNAAAGGAAWPKEPSAAMGAAAAWSKGPNVGWAGALPKEPNDDWPKAPNVGWAGEAALPKEPNDDTGADFSDWASRESSA